MSRVLPQRRHLNRALGMIPWGRGLLPLLILLFVMVRIGEADGTASRWAGRTGCRRLPLFHGLMAVIFFGVFFEVILPLVKGPAVADPWDLLMYLTGFMIFQWGLNRCGTGGLDRHSREEFSLHHPPV